MLLVTHRPPRRAIYGIRGRSCLTKMDSDGCWVRIRRCGDCHISKGRFAEVHEPLPIGELDCVHR